MMRHRFSLLITAVIVVRSEFACACATCFGVEGDPQTEGLNAAIITLISITYTLFFGMALTAFLYWKKNRVNLENLDIEVESPTHKEPPTTHD